MVSAISRLTRKRRRSMGPSPYKKRARRASQAMEAHISLKNADMRERLAIPPEDGHALEGSAPRSPTIAKNLFSGGSFCDSSSSDEDDYSCEKNDTRGCTPQTSYRSRSLRFSNVGQPARVAAPDVARVPITPVKASRAIAERRDAEIILSSPPSTDCHYESPSTRAKLPFPVVCSPIPADVSPVRTPRKDFTPRKRPSEGRNSLSVCGPLSTWSPWASPASSVATSEQERSSAIFSSPPPRTPHRQSTPTPSRQRVLTRKEVLVRLQCPSDPQGVYPTPFEELETVGWLGSGVTAEVLKVYSSARKEYYAVKKSKHELRSERERELLLQEIRIAERLVGAGVSFNHLVRYHQAWQLEGYLHVQMELCGGGTLRDFASTCEQRRVPEEYLWTIINHVASGLKVLHENDIVHLDIKPDNIFLTKDAVLKVGDFGIAIDSSSKLSKKSSDFEGDPAYMAKELLSAPNRDPSADVFCLGIMIYELVTGIVLPTSGETWHDLREGNLGALPSDCSSHLSGLIAKMMHTNPSSRPSTEQILAEPFVEASWAPAGLLLDYVQHSSTANVARPKQVQAARLSCSETPRKPRLSLSLFND